MRRILSGALLIVRSALHSYAGSRVDRCRAKLESGRVDDANEFKLIGQLLGPFVSADLTGTLADIELRARGLTKASCARLLQNAGVSPSAVQAATAIKRLAGQIHVTIHALGILSCLPHILKRGEKIEYLSLGAGNTGRSHDLETNLRIAEFKFVNWRGGPESIRQNGLFKDFFRLAGPGRRKGAEECSQQG
jgi:hypothetical protein